MKSVPFVLAIVAMSVPGAALAGPREDVVQGILRCGLIADDRQWLDCVYGAAQPMRAQLGLPPAPLAQQRLVPAFGAGPAMAPGPAPAMGSAPPPGYRPQTAYAPPPQPDRGFFERIIGEPNVADMTARMASYSFGKDGQFTVTLANGQIWKQISDEPLARWSRPAASYSVTIKPGAFHTFNLIVDDEAQVFKVKRIH